MRNIPRPRGADPVDAATVALFGPLRGRPVLALDEHGEHAGLVAFSEIHDGVVDLVPEEAYWRHRLLAEPPALVLPWPVQAVFVPASYVG